MPVPRRAHASLPGMQAGDGVQQMVAFDVEAAIATEDAMAMAEIAAESAGLKDAVRIRLFSISHQAISTAPSPLIQTLSPPSADSSVSSRCSLRRKPRRSRKR